MGLGEAPPNDPAQILLQSPAALGSPASSGTASLAADALIGELSVTNSGQAAYALPLQVPIGINGLVPNMQLTYQSVRRNGILGPGWQISGFSSIGRCFRTTGQDDSAGPINDSADDRFCLDGQRLVAIQGAYGADGTEYRTELESFTRIFSRGNPGAGADYTGPMSFEVWTPDGHISLYGTGSAVELKDNVRRTWGIAQIRDRFNNTIEFTYTTRICDEPTPGSDIVLCFGTGLVPKEIRYGAHAAGSETDSEVDSDRLVRFVYSMDRDDRNTRYERGLVRVLRHRLDAIEMIAADSPAWAYHLRYELVGGVNHMAGVMRCAGSPTPTCTPETKFTYASIGQAATRAPIAGDLITENFGNGPQSRYSGRTVVLDVNGDGRDDILTPRFSHKDAGGVSHYTYRILLGQFAGVPVGAPIDTAIGSGINDEPDGVYPCFSQESVVDFNRDGKDDLVDLCQSPAFGWRVFLSTGSGFTTLPLPFLSDEFVSRTPLQVADFDGDGWFDFMLCEGPETASNYVFYRNRGHVAGFFPGRAMPQIGRDCYNTSAMLIDIDGDGVVNVFRAIRNAHQEYVKFSQPFEVAPPWVALVISATTAAWVEVPMSGGAPEWRDPEEFTTVDDDFAFHVEFAPGAPLSSDTIVTPLVPLWQFKILDWNGDGLSDMLTFYGLANSGPRRVSLYVNTGAGFTRMFAALGENHELDNYAFYRTSIVDWDADGRQDLLVPIGHPLQQAPQLVLFRSTARGGLFEPVTLGGSMFDYSVPVAADFDGDGDADILIPETENALSYIRATTNIDHLLKTAEDGLGKRDLIHYARSPGDDAPAYSFTTDCITSMTQCLRRVSPLVLQTELLQRKHNADGQVEYPLVRRSTFAYQDARVGFHGRGGLGFAQVGRFDDAPFGQLADTITTTFDNKTFLDIFAGTTARRWYPFAGQILTTTTTHGHATDLLNSAFTRVANADYRPLTIQISADGRPFAVAPQTSQQATDSSPGQAGQTVLRATSSRTFDSYGNTLLETVEWRNASSQVVETRTTGSTFEIDAVARASWLIRCPDQSFETSSAGGETRTRTVREGPCLAPGTPTRITREPTSSDASVFLDLEFSYDRFGNQTSVVATDLSGAIGRVSTYEYDARGLTMTRRLDGNTLETTLAFDPVHGGVRSETAPNGVTRITSYDALSRPIGMITPDGSTTLVYEIVETFDPLVPDGRLRIQRIDSGGDQTEIVVDALGRSVQTRSSGYFNAPVTQERRYDYAGRVLYQSAVHLIGDTQQGSTTFEYDRLGRLRFERRTDESAAGGVAVTQWRYGPAIQADQNSWDATTKARAISVIENIAPSGAIEVRGRDHTGQTVVARDAHGSVTQYASGAFGIPTQVRNSAGNLTTFQHDLLGRRTTLVDPDRGTEVTTYDPYDATRTTRDATGAVTSFAYDLLGRPLLRSDGDGTMRTYEYDGPGAQGQLVEAATLNSAGVVTTRINYEYLPGGVPGAGQISLVRRMIAGETFDTRMVYDDHGRLSTLHYPGIDGGISPFAVRHTYDTAGHLIAVEDSVTDTLYWSLAVSDQGYRIGRELFGDGTETQWAYQARAGRIAGIETRRQNDAAKVLQQLSFGYDAHEELATRSDHVDPSRSRRYEYDLLGRLTRVVQQHGGGSATQLEQFGYNSIGNITSRSSLGTYTYGTTKPHAVTSVGATTYGYDARGNQIVRTGPAVAGGKQLIDYTSFDMPARITTGTGSTQSVTDFIYDANQQRVFTSTSSGKETWYVGEIYERERTATSIAHRYRVYGPGRVVAEITREQAAPFQPIGPRVAHYLHPDGLGSPDLVTDGVGAVVARPQFEPFGNQSAPSQGVVTGFTGHRQSELGLIDMRGRFYDPVLGRFLTPDPIVGSSLSSQAFNRYSYVRNRPLLLTDPSGWQPVTQPYEVAGPITRPSQIPESVETVLPADAIVIDIYPKGLDDGSKKHGSGNGASVGRGDSTPAGGSGGRSDGKTAGVSTGGGAGKRAGVGTAIGAAAAGVAVGAAGAAGMSYALGALSAICAPCAIGVGIGLALVAVYHLVDGGAEALYDSGNRIVHGEGTASDYFSVGSVLGGVAGGFSRTPFNAGRSRATWGLDKFRRGGVIEKALGQNLPQNFPVIDKFENGLATSIKSVDLRMPTYQDANKLSNTLIGYVNKVAAFNGRRWAGVNIPRADISGRALEVAVPRRGGTSAQEAALEAAVQHGRSVGVTVTIIRF